MLVSRMPFYNWNSGKEATMHEVKKLGERIIHIPDRETKLDLAVRAEKLKSFTKTFSHVSGFGKSGGLKASLVRHKDARFFVLIDFVYAFHQITREMAVSVLPFLGNKFYDCCFVNLNGRQIIPQGFSSSSYIFELFMRRAIDPRLMAWANENHGEVTRYCDNILVTWQKNTEGVFSDLLSIFEKYKIRVTPQNPRRWNDEIPIRFCSLLLFRDGRVGISRQRKWTLTAKVREAERVGKIKNAKGVRQFINFFSEK